jgi:hypothetical protein
VGPRARVPPRDGLESAGELLFLYSLLAYVLRHQRDLIIRLK